MKILVEMKLTFAVSDAVQKAATEEQLERLTEAVDEALDEADVTGLLERTLKDVLNNPAQPIKVNLD